MILSANVAANKAFIVNRVGDFGFIIGLMILWTWCGTFQFGDYEKTLLTAEIESGKGTVELARVADQSLTLEGADRGVRVSDLGTGGRVRLRFRGKAGTVVHITSLDLGGKGPVIDVTPQGIVQLTLDSNAAAPTTASELTAFLDGIAVTKPGLFSMLRDHHGELTAAECDHVMLRTEQHGDHWDISSVESRQRSMPYTLLVVAGLGVFAGCIGKSELVSDRQARRRGREAAHVRRTEVLPEEHRGRHHGDHKRRWRRHLVLDLLEDPVLRGHDQSHGKRGMGEPAEEDVRGWLLRGSQGCCCGRTGIRYPQMPGG